MMMKRTLAFKDPRELTAAGFQLTSLVVGSLFTNCYILHAGPKEAMVVDPGADPDVIMEALQEEDLKVRYILVTHAHFDHVCAVKALQDSLGGETLLHAADLPLWENLPAQGAAFGMSTGPIPRVDRLVKEGDLLSLGGCDFQIIHTPGHSPGGISLLSSRMVLVGDTLFAGSIGRTDLPGGNHDQLLRSIRSKLLSLKDDIRVFPGHGEATTIGQERRSNPFLMGE
jgi:hydroxyacylglutathione hydrolase